MRFKVGDVVVHPVYGVGDIVTVEEKRLSGIGPRLYYEMALPRGTIWIPVASQTIVGLRLVTAKSDLDQYRDVLKGPPVLPENEHPQRRHMELARRLKHGSFQVLCEVVRDLTALGWRKPLGPTDKAVFQKAREKLRQEWAVAADISISEATKEIATLLQTTQETTLKYYDDT